MTVKMIAVNKKARHEYHVLERFEAGLSLLGPEVKSVRAGGVNFKDAYVVIEKMQVWLEGLHIAPYAFATCFDEPPTRRRRLLLHRHQIQKLQGKITEKGLTIVPLAVFIKGPWVKVEIGLVRGKKLYDRREDIVRRDQERDVRRLLKERSQ